MSAGMPQGSYLGPLTFVILIDSLQPTCMTHKYVDDTTLTEFLNKSDISCMQTLFPFSQPTLFKLPPCLKYLCPHALILLRLWRYMNRTYLLTFSAVMNTMRCSCAAATVLALVANVVTFSVTYLQFAVLMCVC